MNEVFIAIKTILQVLGSLAVFLFGMKIMSDGLQKAAGKKLQGTLNVMTKNRFVGMLTGTGITALIQSSSATTVMVVGFANAGLITLKQSISVIMGANIGTTITAWIVSIASVADKFDVLTYSLMLLAFMIPLMFSKKTKFNSIAEAIIGLVIIFIGLEYISGAMDIIKPQEGSTLYTFLQGFDGNNFKFYHVMLFALIGAILTAVLQSSSAITAIAITLVVQGILPFLPVAALVVGSNIGTTVTAVLASLGATTAAKRASLAHFLFNVAGSIWVLLIFKPFVSLVEVISGPLAALVTPEAASDAEATIKLATINVAVFHTLFNVINTFLLIGFITPFAKLVEKIIPEKKSDIEEKYELKYISAGFQDTPQINIQNAKIELKKMANVTIRMFELFKIIFNNDGKNMEEQFAKLRKIENYTDQMEEQISIYLQHCDQESITYESHLNITSMIRIAHELENIGDSCLNLGIVSQKKNENEIKFATEATSQIVPFIDITKKFMDFIYKHMNEKISADQLKEAMELESQIDDFRSKLTREARTRIQKGSDVKNELLYLDLLKHIEHIGDSSLNIAQELRAMK